MYKFCPSWVLISIAMISSVTALAELKLLHVVFSQKSYGPFSDISGDGLPKELSYEYFHSAATDMPNVSKKSMFDLGVHLRVTYDKFLGSTFTKEVMRMRTSEYPLSMLAAQLVDAALWPPAGEQIWSNDLKWQPTPTEYVIKEKDTLLLGLNCPSFLSETMNVLKTPEVQKMVSSYLALFEFVSQETGLKIQYPSDIVLLHNSLQGKANLNETIPMWAYEIPRDAIYNLTILEYNLLTYTPLQRKLIGGTMLKEIIGNSLKYINGLIPNERKIMLYSGDDRNLVGLLKTLDLWSPHIPSDGSALIFELHYDNETKIYGTKVKYYTGPDGYTIPLRIPNCMHTCPLKTFLTMFFDVLPETEELLCKQMIPTRVEDQTFEDSQLNGQSQSRDSQNAIILNFLMIICAIFSLA